MVFGPPVYRDLYLHHSDSSWQLVFFQNHLTPWEPATFISKGYDPYIEGPKPSFFMVLGSKGLDFFWHLKSSWKQLQLKTLWFFSPPKKELMLQKSGEKPHLAYIKPCKSWDFNLPSPQLLSFSRISEPSTVTIGNQRRNFEVHAHLEPGGHWNREGSDDYYPLLYRNTENRGWCLSQGLVQKVTGFFDRFPLDILRNRYQKNSVLFGNPL